MKPPLSPGRPGSYHPTPDAARHTSQVLRGMDANCT